MSWIPAPPSIKRYGLKEPAGWFAAGRSFRQAMQLLSDGAFKLLAYLCLEADRSSGTLQASHKQLAIALGKSKRAIGTYVEELQQKGVCEVLPGRNQYASSCFQITDDYWPYHRSQETIVTEENHYLSTVREAYLDSGCSSGQFGPADVRFAKSLDRRGTPLEVVLDAILLGCCRKHISWLNGGVPEPIASLAYFEPVIAEVSQQPLPEDYRRYLRSKTTKLAEIWRQKLREQQQPSQCGYEEIPGSETVH